jgi:hypothetical protein
MPNMSFTNNAATTLASGISAVATSLTVATGTGVLFPTLAGSQYFYCTLENTAGTLREIVKVTARSTDTFTIVRAQDSTTAQSWSTGDKVELRIIAAELNNFPKLDEVNTYSAAQTFSVNPVMSGLTASVPVFTDSSKNLTSTGTVPTNQGGTGLTTFTAANNAIYSTSSSALTAGTLPIAAGGTNSTATPTAGGIGYGTGTAHAYTTVGTSGQALVSAGASAPSFGTLGIAGGGTGLTSTPANGALDIGNGTGFTRTTLTQGSGITITNGAGSITIASSGGGGGGSQQMSFAVYPTTVFNSTGTPMVNTGTGTFNWTCPTGVTRVSVSVVAGGGGGSSAGCATNGSAGGVAIGTYAVTAGTVYAVTVGAGGAGSASVNGATGGSSSFSSFCSATGGLGGNGTSSAPVTGAGTGGNIRNSPANYYITMVPLHVPSFNGGSGPFNAVNADSTTTPSYTWTIGSKSAAGAGGNGGYPTGGVTGLVLITWIG